VTYRGKKEIASVEAGFWPGEEKMRRKKKRKQKKPGSSFGHETSIFLNSDVRKLLLQTGCEKKKLGVCFKNKNKKKTGCKMMYDQALQSFNKTVSQLQFSREKKMNRASS
jgi:hypothetical protein